MMLLVQDHTFTTVSAQPQNLQPKCGQENGIRIRTLGSRPESSISSCDEEGSVPVTPSLLTWGRGTRSLYHWDQMRVKERNGQIKPEQLENVLEEQGIVTNNSNSQWEGTGDVSLTASGDAQILGWGGRCLSAGCFQMRWAFGSVDSVKGLASLHDVRGHHAIFGREPKGGGWKNWPPSPVSLLGPGHLNSPSPTLRLGFTASALLVLRLSDANGMTAPALLAPACSQQTEGILSLHNCMSQFLIRDLLYILLVLGRTLNTQPWLKRFPEDWKVTDLGFLGSGLGWVLPLTYPGYTLDISGS